MNVKRVHKIVLPGRIVEVECENLEALLAALIEGGCEWHYLGENAEYICVWGWADKVESLVDGSLKAYQKDDNGKFWDRLPITDKFHLPKKPAWHRKRASPALNRNKMERKNKIILEPANHPIKRVSIPQNELQEAARIARERIK